MNKVIIIGRAGKDPETVKTDTVNITKFSLAVSEHFKDKQGNKQEKTEWFNVVCFSNLATIAENYIHKGDQVCIEVASMLPGRFRVTLIKADIRLQIPGLNPFQKVYPKISRHSINT